MTKEPPMKRIRKPEYKRNHPYVSERDARNLDDFFSPILCAGLRRSLTLKLEHIPADFKTEKEWKDTIRQMLWSFEQHHLDCPDDPYSIWYDREERKLKAAGIPAFKVVIDPHSKLMELTNNFPAWPKNLADETCAYENKVKKASAFLPNITETFIQIKSPRPWSTGKREKSRQENGCWRKQGKSPSSPKVKQPIW